MEKIKKDLPTISFELLKNKNTGEYVLKSCTYKKISNAEAEEIKRSGKLKK